MTILVSQRPLARPVPFAVTLGALLMLGACTTIMPSSSVPATPAPATPPAAAASGGNSPPGAAPSPNAAPSAPQRAFNDIVKDAKSTPGLFPLWRKDEKAWIEIAPDQFGKPFFLSIAMSRGLGERMLFGGLMQDRYMVEFHKVGPLVQLIAKNTQFWATPGSPEARAVRDGFSDSLLSSATVASQPHPERKSVLIEVNSLLFSDIPAGAHALERAYRNSYTFDARNSFIAHAYSNADETVVDVGAHYTLARIPLPPPPSPTGGPAAPFFPPPDVVEDPRSLFLGYVYNFAKLPEQPMAPRLADSRVGHFVTTHYDFSSESSAYPRRFLVNRWRLEKKDPAAAMSEPVKPIVFWLDREIPVKYRDSIRAGILEWNKAFAKLGFIDAIHVEQQPDDAGFDTLDVSHASIKWMTTATPSFGAIGPSQTDPRTGEILDADIGWDASQTRAIRNYRAEAVSAPAAMYDAQTGELSAAASGIGRGTKRNDAAPCLYFDSALGELELGLAVLESRGEIDPDSPQAEEYVQRFLKDVTMHEVGHTLGLRHNFRASTVFSLAQMSDPAFSETHGLTGSVMDYAPINISLKGERTRLPFASTLGPYDYWAIEYAYKPIAPGDEKAELERIAARSNQPELAFATDDAVGESLDPDVNQSDLGSDPLAWYRRRVALSRELWASLESRTLRPGDSYELLRRRYMTGFAAIATSMGLAAKYVGGVSMVYDRAGSNRLPITPTPQARQREALALLTDGLFKSDSFALNSQFQRKLVLDRLQVDALRGKTPSDLGLPALILGAQRDVLNRLMSPLVAQHLLNSSIRSTHARDTLTLADLYSTLQSAIWSEARAGGEVDLLRRNLQREHLQRLTLALVGQGPALPPDARSLLRMNARTLHDQLASARGRSSLSPETRAHYAEAYEILDEALKAQLVRSAS